MYLTFSMKCYSRFDIRFDKREYTTIEVPIPVYRYRRINVDNNTTITQPQTASSMMNGNS